MRRLTPVLRRGNTAAMLIYKILRRGEWADLRVRGRTAGAPVDLADGFVHFSTADQAVETATRHFAGVEGLFLLAVDSDGLGPDLKWEPSRGGALFPHLYGQLALSDVLWTRPLPLHEAAHLFPEEVAGHVDPTRAQFDAFKGLAREHPIEMLNLVRLRASAAYPEGHALAGAGLSGDQAYVRYGTESGPVFARVGGTVVWRGDFQSVLIGPDSESWDRIFVARYPSAHAFLEMVTDPAYRTAVLHRQAAVRTSRLIRCALRPAGAGFA